MTPDCHSDHCVTCADDAGAHHTVETALVEPVRPGDALLVHAGVALVAL